MPLYKFWYKKEVKARNLSEAMKVEKKHGLKFDSVVEDEDHSERELHPLIGFSTPTEFDYEDDND